MTETEYAITLKPHWAYSVFHLGKDIENRSWRLPQKYENRRIWIHSGRTASRGDLRFFADFLASIKVDGSWDDFLSFPCGAIVGNVKFYDPSPEENIFALANNPWAMPDFYHWGIEHIELLSTPVPAKGKLSFWDCTELVKEVA